MPQFDYNAPRINGSGSLVSYPILIIFSDSSDLPEVGVDIITGEIRTGVLMVELSIEQELF
jgi:hypothetical protein